MQFKFVTAAIVAALACAPAFGATKIDDPVKFVRSIFVQLEATSEATPFNPPVDIYTPRLAALFALDNHESGNAPGRMDCEFWCGCLMEWQVTKAHITAVSEPGVDDREIVIAKFRDFGHPSEMRFYFEKIKGQWKLDDARSPLGSGWALSLVLKYGWDDGR